MSPKNFKSTGLILTLIGAVLFILAILIIVVMLSRRTNARAAVKTDQDNCVKVVRSLGFEADAVNDDVVAKLTDLSEGVVLLSQSSLAINACPGWTLQRYCMGQSCNPSGLQFTLQRAKK